MESVMVTQEEKFIQLTRAVADRLTLFAPFPVFLENGIVAEGFLWYHKLK